MDKVDNLEYQYRYGANQEIRSILQLAKHLPQSDLYKNNDIYFEPVSIYYVCSELVEISKLPENPYLLCFLQKKYEQVKVENGGRLLFSFEELFSEGWLQITSEEWLWNSFSYEYEKLNTHGNEKEEQIVTFLKSLKETPYKDGLYPIIDEESTEFLELLKKTRLSVEWFLEKKLLIRKKNELYINTFSNEWEIYGERVLSKKYEEWNCLEEISNTEKWIHYCEFFVRCWRPEKYIDNKEKLFEYCLGRLEKEESSWEQEVVYVAKSMQISANMLKKKNKLSIPEYGVERQIFIETYFERWCRLEDIHSRRTIYFGICLRNYHVLSEKWQKKFCRILKKPYFEVQYFNIHSCENEICLADCVMEYEIFIPAICNIFHYIIENCRKDELKKLYFRQLTKPIWDICYNGLNQSNKASWVRNLIELLVYLYNKGNFYRKNRWYFSSVENNYKDFLEKLMKFYFKEIPENQKLDCEVIGYLLIKLGNSKDHNIQNYLGVLMLFAKQTELYVENQERKCNILYGLFNGLITWIKIVKKRDILLSTVDWTFFSEAVWNDVLLQNHEKLIYLFDMLSIKELKEVECYKQNKSIILGVGNLALLGLYFQALCLNKLHNDISFEIIKSIEANFIQEFICCQNEWKLFSSENIRLADSSIVLSACMQVLSLLNENNRESLINNLKIEEVIDVVFWLEYVKNKDIKNTLLNILIKVQKERLFDGICFLPTWQIAIDNLLKFCFDESEEDKEVIKKMMEFAEYSLKGFKEVLKNKPESVRKDYREWQESAYFRILLLKNQTEEILSSNNEFYKGVIWLNSDKLEEIQRAKKTFADSDEVIGSWKQNYLIACVLEIVKKKELGLDYANEVKKYEKDFLDYISMAQNSYLADINNLYIYGLFLYLSIDKKENFWALYNQMPEELYKNKWVVNYVIEVYLSYGNVTEARKQLTQLQKVYGETPNIRKLQEKIVAEDSSEGQTERPIVQSNIVVDRLSCIELRHMLLMFKQKSNSFLAEVMIDEEEFQYLDNKSREKMHDKHEIHIISMICQSLKILQNYSVNLIHNKKVASEDVYNRTLKLLFNLREERFLGFRLEEQTQGGTTKTTYRSGEQGVGRRDLMMLRKENAVALLEGIKLWRVEKKKINDHIHKLSSYNIERVPIVIMPIYGYMDNEKNFWENYVKLLHKHQTNKEFGIIKVEEMDELLKTEFSAGLQYIVKTKHNYKNFEVTVYHIMIKIKI